jgi:serine/threonine protein kinase/tetratricopeptide (TPR) repeat protein
MRFFPGPVLAVITHYLLPHAEARLTMAVRESPEKSIFLQAIEKNSPAERAAFLDAACQDNPQLRAEVEALLRAHEAPQPVLDAREPGSPTMDDPVSERPGTSIGPYKLLQEIGEGGMGTVFMAEQSRPVQRKVALKLIKAGMDSRQVIARFEAERQALAIMDHPNIAKVLDAGTTAAGRPYFVMELVKGVPITKYCDEHHLTPKERLELFVPVCQAVQHAHQKGIIHRDLKPSNVLVCIYDGKPVPKIIDFGVAKATGYKLTERTLFTEFGAIVGTFEYMSPEQAQLDQLDIDTRSDIYSLGVMLYELLTGTTPLERKRLKQLAVLELLRLVREEEPPRPSTRLSTVQELPSIAANRGLEPRKLSGLVRGELDWIVMKCLEKDRNRRYETANGLARDIERYLQDETVSACPPSTGYRLRKFARKNRKVLISVGAFALVLLTGAGVSTWQAVRATRAQHVADLQRERAQGNLQVALKALDGIYLQVAEERLPRDPRRKKEDTELLKKALDFYQQFAEQNDLDIPARLEVSRAYRRVGDIQEFVGENAAAQQAYEAAIARARELATEFPFEAEYTHQLAACHIALGEALLQNDDVATTADHFQEATSLLTRLTSDYPTVPQYRADLANSHRGLGKLYKKTGSRRDAEEQFRQALDLQGQLAGDLPDVPQYRLELAETHQEAGWWLDLLNVDGTAKPVEHMRSAERLLSDLVTELPTSALYRYRLAITLQSLATFAGQFDGRSEFYRRAVAQFSKLAEEFPQVPEYRFELGRCYGNFGLLYHNMGNDDQATKYFRQGLAEFAKLADEFPTQTKYRAGLATGLSNWADMLILHGELAQARKALEESLDHVRALLKSYPNSSRYATEVLTDEYSLAFIAEVQGEGDKAATLRHDAEQLFAKTWQRVQIAEGSLRAASFCADLGRGLQDTGVTWRKGGQPDAVAKWNTLALRAYAQAIALDRDSAETYFNRGELFEQVGQYEKAAADFSRVIELNPKGPEAWYNDPNWGPWRKRANAYLKLGQHEKAIADYSKVIELDPNHPDAAISIYNIACIHALMIPTSPDHAKQAGVATEWLQKAVAAGYRDIAQIKKDTDLDVLRGREDFKKLLADLEKKTAQKKQ